MSITASLNELSERYGKKFLSRTSEEVGNIIADQLSYLKTTDYDSDAVDPRANLHLDTTKLSLHPSRVNAFLEGQHVAPITIDMALTQKCSYACTFCYAGLQQNPSAPAEWETYKNFLDDCVMIGHKKGEGVKGISLVSDGESTESPHFQKFIEYGRSLGIDMAVGTNGRKLENFDLEILSKSLTYLRINFNAGHPDAYQQVMGCSKESLDAVLKTTKEIVRIKRTHELPITIGYQMVLMPEYADQVLPLASLSRDIGIDYLVIKHCSDDEVGRLGVDYSWYVSEQAEELLKTAERFSTASFSCQAKWSKIKTGRDRIYSKCYGTPLLLQMSGTGIVAPCGSFFHNDYSHNHIGDIKTERFFDIWNSQRYKDVMKYLRSDKFNAKNMCATLCLQDKVNEQLYEIIENGEAMKNLDESSLPHRNFI